MSRSGRRAAPPPFDPAATVRPDPTLLRYYLVVSILTGPLFPVIFLSGYCRYISLRYRFDEEGVSMAWGVLFKREINLAYRRIQDIHVKRGLIQRWLGLASVGVQTASASATPEMTIDGVMDYDGLRDFLYARMRGAKGIGDLARDGADAAGAPGGEPDQTLALLAEIRDGVIALRERVERLESAGSQK